MNKPTDRAPVSVMPPMELPPGTKLARVRYQCPTCDKVLEMFVVVGPELMLVLPQVYCYHPEQSGEDAQVFLMKVRQVPTLEDPPRVSLAL